MSDTPRGAAGRPQLSGRARAVVAVTFFSMFFGAGNLIFPPYVGALAGNQAPAALLGFIISAVGLPVLGVVAVSFAGGFARLAGRVSKGFATVLAIAIILTIGPLFAIPRTASTSFEMAVAPFVGDGAQGWAQLAYSLVFFVLAFLVAQRPEKLSKVLGRIMGPVLLAMIVVLLVVCLFIKHPSFSAPAGPFSANQFGEGFLNGYQTMDLLAGLYFGIVISANIRDMGVKGRKANRRETARSGVFAGIMLVVVYAALGFIGMVSGSIAPIDADADTGATVLTNLTQHAFGETGTVFVGIIFVIACFNVCAGLISTVSSFFHDRFPTVGGTKVGYRAWSALFTLVSLVISNLGLNAIIKISEPILEALYPIAIVLVVLSLLHKRFTGKHRRVYFWTVLFTAIDSVGTCIVSLTELFGGHIDWLSQLLDSIPLSEISLGWVVPAFVGAVIGFDISMFHRNWKHDEDDMPADEDADEEGVDEDGAAQIAPQPDEGGKPLTHRERKEARRQEARRAANEARKARVAAREEARQAPSPIAGGTTVAQQVRMAQEAKRRRDEEDELPED